MYPLRNQHVYIMHVYSTTIYIMYITLCQFHLLEKEKQRHLQKLPYDLSFASPCLFEALSIKGTGSAFFTSLKVVFMPSTCLAKACFSLQDSSVSTLSWVSAIPMWVFGGWFLLRGDFVEVSKAPELWRIVWSRSHYKFRRWEKALLWYPYFPISSSTTNHEKSWKKRWVPSLWQATNMVLWQFKVPSFLEGPRSRRQMFRNRWDNQPEEPTGHTWKSVNTLNWITRH